MSGATGSGTPWRTRIAQTVIGPWPLRPVLLWIIIVVVYQYSSGSTIASSSTSVLRVAVEFPINGVLAAIPVIPLAIVQVIHRRRAGDAPLPRGAYLVTLLATGVWAAFVRFITTGGEFPGETDVFLYLVVRSTIFVFAMHSVFGIADARLRAQVRRADEATAVVESQRRAVLAAEERARRSVADLLHNRVQAGLLALMLQMRLLQRSTDEGTASALAAVIDEMERMRTEDVRAASRQLSPDIEEIGLLPALEELAATYRPGMSVTVEVERPDDDWAVNVTDARATQLGIFRIVEQGLLNAAAHGRAEHVVVRITRTGALDISVTDDGMGPPIGERPRGAGTAVIDAWAGVLGGTWRLDRRAEHTVLLVHVPAGGPPDRGQE